MKQILSRLIILGSFWLVQNLYFITPAFAANSGPFTAEVWVNPTTSTASKAILGKAEELRIFTDASGFVGCQIKVTTWQTAAQATTNALTLNTWSHVACAYDKANLKVYVNGVQVGSTALTSAPDDTTAVWRIGQDDSASTPYANFTGSVDDFNFYNYARTSKQIVEDMNAGHPVGGSPVGSQLGYWKFDEGYGSTAYDSTGKQNLVISNVTWTNQGKFGKAVDFNSSAATAEVYYDDITSSIYDLTNDFSFGAWVYRSNTPSSQARIISKGDNYLIFTTTNNIPVCYMSGLTSTSLTASSALPLNQWIYILCTLKNNVRKLYINGKLDVQDTPTGSVSVNNLDFVIGNYDSPSDSYRFRGIIDEVKIYNYALTEDEIKLDYNRGSAMVLGTLSDTSGLTGGSVASSSAAAAYCIPGDTTSCSAPVAEWNMDEKTGTNAYDTSGNGKTGVLTNSPSWSAGKIGSAISFNGSSNFVNLSSLTATTAPYTVEFWMYPKALPGSYQTIISMRGANTYPTFNLASNNKLLAYAGVEKYKYGTKVFSSNDLNKWWHVAFTVTDSSSLTNWKVYLNGVDDTGISGGNTGTYYDPSTSGAIGNNISNQYFNGLIDQVRIYNYARTPAQIAWDYNRGGPVGWWKMDECQGNVANDASGNANNGTITIGATGTQSVLGTCSVGVGSTAAWGNGSVGKYNSSLNFDGTDDYVYISDPTNNSLDPSYVSVSAWVKSTTINHDTSIVNKQGSSTDRAYIIWTQTNNYPNFSISTTGSDVNTATATTALTTGTWYHITGTYDGSNVKIYINGRLENTQPKSGTIYNSTDRVEIGWIPDAWANQYYFNGQIDDVKIFNYALTANQVKNLFNENSSVRFGP